MGRNNQKPKEEVYIRTHGAECSQICEAEFLVNISYYRSLLKKICKVYDNYNLTLEEKEAEIGHILDAYEMSLTRGKVWDPADIKRIVEESKKSL